MEEVNQVVSGGNYGWAVKEGTFLFNRTGPNAGTDNPVNSPGSPAGLIDPILEYDHNDGSAVVGGFVYHGSLLPQLDGKYVFGDFSNSSFAGPANGRLFYADLSTGQINEFNLNTPLGMWLKGFGEDANGEIYVLASQDLGPTGTTGVVLEMVPEPSSLVLMGLAACLTLLSPQIRNKMYLSCPNKWSSPTARILMQLKSKNFTAAFSTIAVLLAQHFAFGIIVGQVDDFQSGTTEGWSNGLGGSNVANIASGGPAGPSDRYLQLASGSFGGSPRLIMFNDAQWLGDYLAAGVVGIKMQLQNFGAAAIPMRIAIREGSGGSFTPGYASTNSFSLPADGQWHSVFFSLTADSLTGVNSPQPVATDLSNVADFRLLSSTVPATIGDIVSAQIGIDDVTAIPLGDVNLDGVRNVADIQAMLTALTNVNSYASSHQLDSVGCWGSMTLTAMVRLRMLTFRH